MTARRRRGEPLDAQQTAGELADGAERYMWAFIEGDHVILSIPGIRDLELSSDDAQMIGEMLLARSNEAKNRASNKVREIDLEDQK
jgi:hypothetical protein